MYQLSMNENTDGNQEMLQIYDVLDLEEKLLRCRRSNACPLA
jgi:hypothetical protein